jgi:hypothetical protein
VAGWGVVTDREVTVLFYLGDTLGAIMNRKRPSSHHSKRTLEASSVLECEWQLLRISSAICVYLDTLDIVKLDSFLLAERGG